MVNRIKEFCSEDTFEGTCAAFLPSLQKYLEDLDRIRQSNPQNSSPVSVITHFTRVDTFQFLSLDPEKIAQMLTLTDHALYKRIKVGCNISSVCPDDSRVLITGYSLGN